MRPFIYGERNGIHIIDLQKTQKLFKNALTAIENTVAEGGSVLVVATKKQAQDIIKEESERAGMFHVHHRWLGGTLTNWRTISGSIARLRELEGVLDGADTGRTKKELLQLTREREKLELSLGGIKDMGGIPDIMFVIDTNK
jgi:small subunit ribosomal protein S2